MKLSVIICLAVATLASGAAHYYLWGSSVPDWTRFVVSALVCLLSLASGWLILTK